MGSIIYISANNCIVFPIDQIRTTFAGSLCCLYCKIERKKTCMNTSQLSWKLGQLICINCVVSLSLIIVIIDVEIAVECELTTNCEGKDLKIIIYGNYRATDSESIQCISFLNCACATQIFTSNANCEKTSIVIQETLIIVVIMCSHLWLVFS